MCAPQVTDQVTSHVKHLGVISDFTDSPECDRGETFKRSNKVK